MKGARRSEDEIRGILKESGEGITAAEICRRHGISQQTFYRWKKKYGGDAVRHMRRLKILEEENSKLKRLLAEKELDIHSLKTTLEKKKR